MIQDLIPISSRQIGRAGLDRLPVTITAAGPSAARRFLEFFTANIRNKNTRAAYAKAVSQFFDWCEEKHFDLLELQPIIIAG